MAAIELGRVSQMVALTLTPDRNISSAGCAKWMLFGKSLDIAQAMVNQVLAQILELGYEFSGRWYILLV
jgi:hypothetical protein